MTTERSLLLHWIETGAIPDERIDAALSAADILPTRQAWRQFIDQLLLWAGMLALVAAVIFFFAYNWDAMGRFAKLGLVEVLIIVALAGYWRLGTERAAGKAALTVAALLLGALMALYGQIYQTGADTWQLFASWALLILPWVVVGRFAALWIVWIALVNLSLFLYFSVFRGLWGLVFSQENQLLLAFIFNTLGLALWELAARRFTWLEGRWAIRLLAIASGTAATMLVMLTIFDWHDSSGWVSVVYPLWAVGIFYFYRYRTPDLFMLAGGSLSLIVVVTSLLARTLLENGDAFAFLFIALVVIGMSALAALWLRKVHAEFES